MASPAMPLMTAQGNLSYTGVVRERSAFKTQLPSLSSSGMLGKLTCLSPSIFSPMKWDNDLT